MIGLTQPRASGLQGCPVTSANGPDDLIHLSALKELFRQQEMTREIFREKPV
jgi:hypothetical protein